MKKFEKTLVNIATVVSSIQETQILKNSLVHKGFCKLFILAILICITWYNLAAQTADSISRRGTVVFSFGNGFSYAGKGDESKAGWGLSIHASLGYESHGFFISVSAGGSAGGTVQYPEGWEWLNSEENGDLILDKHDQFFDLGLKLGGTIKVTQKLYLTVLTGATTVTANRIYVTSHTGFLSDEVHEVHRKFSEFVFGIPLETGINYRFIDTMSVGLSANSNFNPLENFYGITINLIFRNPD